jgi:hypothetical protein
MISRPARAYGTVSAWISEGAVKPREEQAAQSSGRRPREAKVTMDLDSVVRRWEAEGVLTSLRSEVEVEGAVEVAAARGGEGEWEPASLPLPEAEASESDMVLLSRAQVRDER